jgi:hypothetical protein
MLVDVTLLQEFSCILVVEGGERLVHKLPAGMLMDLATIASERIEGVSSRWAATEELCWTAPEARVVIDDLMRLARRAADTGRSLFIWNCL